MPEMLRKTCWPALMLLLVLTGCMETRVVRHGFDDLRALAGQQAISRKSGSSQISSAGSRQDWGILLARFTGPNRHVEASSVVRELRERFGVEDAWVREVSGTAHVFRGRFGDPGSELAAQALQETRRLHIPGHSFSDVRLSVIPREAEPVSPLDLHAHRGHYTLQIGYYDDTFEGDRRKAAEQAVETLREQGHEAYFYHGPVRSMVTVGLFDYPGAFVPKPASYDSNVVVQTYSPTVRKLQERFPYNLGNSLALDQRQHADGVEAQTSALVRVP